jgi:hypothetical protein
MTAKPGDAAMEKSADGHLRELVHWAPALLLLLYVLGYVAANGHYSRYEPVKADLLSARYLSAGLLYVAFGGLPGLGGYLGGVDAASAWRPGSKHWAVIICLGYLLGVGLPFGLLCLSSLVDLGHPRVWSSIAWMFALAGFTGIVMGIFAHKPPQGALRKSFQFSGAAMSMVVQAYTFGLGIHPSVKPHFGGAAVREGYVVLKPGAHEVLHYSLRDQPLPFLDLDDQFLYVIACRKESTSSQPETIMIALDLVASAGVASSRNQFVVIPEYVAEHHCGRVEVKKGPLSTENGTP